MAICASIRPMNESTISRAEMSIRTPLGRPVLEIRLGQVFLEGQDHLVVQVDLDRDE